MKFEPIVLSKTDQDFINATEKLKWSVLYALGIPQLTEWLSKKLQR